MDVLVLLAASANEVVTREKLLSVVWAGQIAADELLTRAISELRRALGDDRGDPKYILTIPKRGYRLIGDVVRRECPERQPVEMAAPAGSLTKGRKRTDVIAGIAAMLIAFFVIDRIIDRPSPSRETGWPGSGEPGTILDSTAQVTHPVPLTSMEGFEYDPALSPDGSFIAFSWMEHWAGRHPEIYISPVGSSSPLRLTDSEYAELSPTWSPDGTRVAFFRMQGDYNVNTRGSIVVRTVLGGIDTEIARVGRLPIGLDWSPDGDLLAYSGLIDEKTTRHRIYLVSLKTGEIRGFTEQKGTSWDDHPQFSPDGRQLAFIRWEGEVGDGADICLQALDQSDVKCIMPENERWLINDIAWTPDSRAIIASTGLVMTPGVLLRVEIQTGITKVLPFGEGALDISIARLGGRFVFERHVRDHNIWRVPGPNGADWMTPTKLIASTRDELSPSFSPDGTKIAFISARSGASQVWVAHSDGSNQRQLTNVEFANYPSWSPDGLQIAFISGDYAGLTSHSDNSAVGFDRPRVFVISSSGGIPQLLSGDASIATSPDWSADGRSIYFTSRTDACGNQLLKRNIDTGELLQLADCVWAPEEGSDGRVYFVDQKSISSVPVNGGEINVELAEHDECNFYNEGWTIWERNLVYIDCQDLRIKMLDLDTRETTVLADVYSDEMNSMELALDVSPDGRWIVYNRLDRATSDLMLVEPFQ